MKCKIMGNEDIFFLMITLLCWILNKVMQKVKKKKKKKKFLDELQRLESC